MVQSLSLQHSGEAQVTDGSSATLLHTPARHSQGEPKYGCTCTHACMMNAYQAEFGLSLWWSQCNVQSTISCHGLYRGHYSTCCVLLCKITGWNCKVTRIAPSSFNNLSVIQRHHSVNYVCGSHFSIICTLRHSSNTLYVEDSNPKLSVI